MDMKNGFVKVFIICVNILFVFSSCEEGSTYLDTDRTNISEYSSEYKINIINNDTTAYSRITDDNLSNADLIIAESFEHFAVERLNQLTQKINESFVFSPLNASFTFSLMNNANKEEEQREINRYLELPDYYSIQNSNEYNRKVIKNIQKELDSNDNEIKISNKIWVKKNCNIYRSFLSTLNSYNANIEGVEFNYDSDRNHIDSYIQDNSNSNNFSLSKEFDGNTNALFTNSIRFSLQWKDKLYTYNDTLQYNSGGIPVSVIKTQIGGFGKFYYVDFGYYSITEIPYIDEDYSMFLIYTPFEDDRYLNVLNDIISRGGIDKCINKMEQTYLNLKFPTFSVENNISLIENNKSFLKFYSKVSPNEQFILNEISQVCALKVDENGTTAKVITGDTVTDIKDLLALGATSLPKFIEVDIDGPFWFLVRNNKLKTILFSGNIKYNGNGK